MTTSRVYRTDISSLRPVERREDGTIRVDAFLTKTGVFQYRQPDGSIRRELRLEDEVFNADSIESFLGVPVTNDHPPGMVDAKNARQFAVGSQIGGIQRDDDHVRGRLAIYDADTIGQMSAGKVQVSCGYTCDCDETPGIHPMFGVYDAVQKNIRGNHIAIVDRARAGITAAARMDGMMVEDGDGSALEARDGTKIAIDVPLTTWHDSCMAQATPAARVEVILRTDAGAAKQPDPDDEAARNARGANDAPAAKKEQPGEMADKGGDIAKAMDPDADDEGDDEDEESESRDAYDESYKDGELTAEARNKIKASNFALPDKEKLPIHDKAHVRAAMSRFGQTDFESADEKHGAFNRIKSKAKQFGVSTEGFQKAHAGKLDRADRPTKDAMTPEEIKELQDKADSRKEKLVKAKSRIDELEIELAARDGKIASLEKDLLTAKTAEPRADKSDEDFTAKVDAKVDLIAKATAAGAKVDAKMSDIEIKRAVIKHVDGDDVPAEKPEPYVDALYEGALKRANKDAADTARGQAALSATRQAIVAATPKQDADDTDEDAAKRRLRTASATQWSRKETK